MTRRLIACAATAVTLATAGVAQGAYVTSTIGGFSHRPGQRIVVAAQVSDFFAGSGARYRCVITATALTRKRLAIPRTARVARVGRRISWAWRIPITAPPEISYRFAVRCPGAGTSSEYLSLSPVRIKVQTGEIQMVRAGSSRFAYTFVVVNPSRQLAVNNLTVRWNLLDQTGQVVSSDSDSVGYLPPSGRVRISGSTTVEAEIPVQLKVTQSLGDGGRGAGPLPPITNLRLLRPTPGEFETPQLLVRAQATNPTDRELTFERGMVALFDGAGFLVDAGTTYVSGLAAGQATGLEFDFAAAGRESVTSAEVSLTRD